MENKKIGMLILFGICGILVFIGVTYAVSPTLGSVTIYPSTAYTTNDLKGETSCKDDDVGDTLTAYWKWYKNNISYFETEDEKINYTILNSTGASSTTIDDSNYGRIEFNLSGYDLTNCYITLSLAKPLTDLDSNLTIQVGNDNYTDIDATGLQIFSPMVWKNQTINDSSLLYPITNVTLMYFSVTGGYLWENNDTDSTGNSWRSTDGGATWSVFNWAWLGALVCENKMYASGSSIVSNNTATNVTILNSGNTTKNEEWLVETWCGDGTTNTSKTNSSILTIQNSAPAFEQIKLNVSDLGGTKDLKIYVKATDDDGVGDLDSAWTDGTNNNYTSFSSGEAWIDVGDELTQNLTLFINDSSTAETESEINFTLSENSLQPEGDYSHSLSAQSVERNDTLENLGSVSFNYSITHTSLTGGSLQSSPSDAELTGGNAVEIYSNWTGDWLTSETEGTYLIAENASYSHNLTSQGIFNTTNLTVSNSQSFTFSSVDLSSFCDVTTSSNIPTGTNEVTQSCSNESYTGDFITGEIEETETQEENSTSQSETKQWIINYTRLNVSNSQSFSFTDVNLSSLCENNVSATIISGASKVVSNCSTVSESGDWINESYSLTLINSSAFVDENITWNVNVSIQNLHEAVNFTNVSVNATKGYNYTYYKNASADLLTQSVNISQTLTQNFNISSREPVIKEITVPTCPVGYTSYGSYCENIGVETDRYTYAYRMWINNTDNNTKDYPIKYNISTSRFDNWNSRVGTTTKINDSSLNVSLTSTGTEVEIEVGTSHASSSLEEGKYYVDVNYHVWRSEVSSPSTGGGRGEILYTCGNGECEPNEVCDYDCDYIKMITPLKNYIGYPGQNLVCGSDGSLCKLIIKNLRSINISVAITISNQADTAYKWLYFISNDKNALITIMKKSVILEIPAESQTELLFNANIPNNITLDNRTVEITYSALSLTKKYPLNITLEEPPVLIPITGSGIAVLSWDKIWKTPIGPPITKFNFQLFSGHIIGFFIVISIIMIIVGVRNLYIRR